MTVGIHAGLYFHIRRIDTRVQKVYEIWCLYVKWNHVSVGRQFGQEVISTVVIARFLSTLLISGNRIESLKSPEVTAKRYA